MKKINVKNLVIFGVLGVVMILVVVAVSQVKTFMSGATSGVEPQSVTAVSGDDGKSAIITWISDKESINKIEYGTTAASLVLMSAESTASTNHSLSLTSLRPSTTYYFKIRVGDEVFDNGGIPYTFKTKADTSAVVTPTQAIVSSPSAGATNSAKTTTQCDVKTDYNKDGIVNSIDLAVCKNNGGTVAATADSMPVATPTIKKYAQHPLDNFTPHVL
jgi:hypothetical protein